MSITTGSRANPNTSEDLPTFAFPYSPAHSDRGALYEFALNHVLTLDTPMDAFSLELSHIPEVAHG
jgi:hypothetical protein